MSDIHTVRAVLLSLIYPMREEEMTAEQKRALSLAAEIQMKYDDEASSGVKSRSVGDVSITYRDQNSGVTVGGTQIAPGALSVLKYAGLLCRWV